ncbi:RagB/SusD family nutrient uptake outer membrane protein [Galbibacter sp. BG1]|uniref:RagB/SusD family nutrient uptake outer membrane protein n=1 Tax=Galbibacter sp. BG1 TaxID=1170699 RepID=UPI0015B83609|nr:RagB/SusD family nutrient uptake outer membrane protein [Galbibacter sp. BG1]QLE02201.1 RagB/SusD family nutrient uptake outer membrane protein [Galbibacter sp. BG1]
MKKTIKYLTIGLLLLIGSFSSCNDSFLEDAEVLNNLNGSTFYSSPDDAVAAVTGAYTILQSRDYYKVQIYALEYALGDYAFTEGGFQYANFENFQFDNTQLEVRGLWDSSFLGIARANVVLERVPEIEFTDEKLKERILGEAHFLRGLYYFFLVKLYGDAPIIDKIVEGPSDPLYFPSRSPKEEVYAFIEADLKAAIDLLPAKEDYADADVGRATKGSAQGYLGKVYLYQEKFQEARDAFKKVIDGQVGNYALVPNYEDNFTDTNENNQESLFEIQFVGGTGNVWAGDDTGEETESTYFGTLFGPGPQVFGNAYPSDDVNAMFDANPNDTIRRKYTVARPGDTWRSWDPVEIEDWNSRIPQAGGNSAIRKGNLGPDESLLQSGINWRLMRYADVLLMFAEAENEVSGPTAAAYAAINEVRARAMVDPLTRGMSKDEFFNAIRMERRLELTFEVSRYFDLIRWGLGSEMPGFKVGKNELLPVPASALNSNPNLAPQNPGW